MGKADAVVRDHDRVVDTVAMAIASSQPAS